MKIKHHDLEPPKKENPFANCKLAREPYAKVLTNVVKTYADGFVLAINNEWGTGKTTFVKMWEKQLENEGFRTIYFNAWENDFDSNPLVAMMSELGELIKEDREKKEKFKSVVKKGAVLVKNVAPALLKAVANKYIDSEIIAKAIENASKASAQILEEEIKEYTSKKKTISEFREELEAFVELGKNAKPLIFIVDELDRCRPTYAVEVLEQMKHFFSVRGIVFVLSIDKNHLASSVRGFYGSEQINTDEYLRRFIDLEYSIPLPSNKTYSQYLFEYYAFDEFFSSTERKNIRNFKNDAETLLKMAEILFDGSKATLRQQEKIFGQTRLVLKSFPQDNFVFSHLLFFLVYLKVMKNAVYSKIEHGDYSLQELSDVYTEIMPSERNSFYTINLLYIEALLLLMYNNNRDDKAIFLNSIPIRMTQSHVKSRLENENDILDNYFDEISREEFFNRGLGLKYLLNKIDLIDPIVS